MNAGTFPENEDLAPLIDHTLLTPGVSSEQVQQAILEAKEFGCASVCIRPQWVGSAAELLRSTPVGVTTVIGFPEGNQTVGSKVRESVRAASEGATELDLVINYQRLTEGLAEPVRREIQAVRAAAPDLVLKIILETATLTEAQIRLGCQIASDGGADFVKTSTGFHPAGGATLAAVRIMAEAVPHMGVKASGGIRTARQARDFLAAGATRLGISGTKAVLFGLGVDGSDY